VGHKPTKILTAGFPFGVSIMTECVICKKTLSWKKLGEITPDEASVIYSLILKGQLEFRNNSTINSFAALNVILEKLSNIMKGSNL